MLACSAGQSTLRDSTEADVRRDPYGFDIQHSWGRTLNLPRDSMNGNRNRRVPSVAHKHSTHNEQGHYPCRKVGDGPLSGQLDVLERKTVKKLWRKNRGCQYQTRPASATPAQQPKKHTVQKKSRPSSAFVGTQLGREVSTMGQDMLGTRVRAQSAMVRTQQAMLPLDKRPRKTTHGGRWLPSSAGASRSTEQEQTLLHKQVIRARELAQPTRFKRNDIIMTNA